MGYFQGGNTVHPSIEKLRSIKTFNQLIAYLRAELDWPIESDDFDDLTFDYEPEELGIDAKTAVKIKEIKQLRPLVSNQPWGIFFVNFEPKQLPIVVLRRILRSLVVTKRNTAAKAHQAAWSLHDLLFISSYGESEHREITFAHFSEPADRLFGDLPTLRVLGWDDDDTKLKIDHVVYTLSEKMRWPVDENDTETWRRKWSDAFELRPREVITTSKELAISLADLAKSIRQRANLILSVESERGPLRKLHKAFQTALIHDLNEDDFADMYAQTISYGLLAARVSRPAGVVAENLADMVPITNPFLKEMLGTFLTAGGRKGKIDFDELGIQEVVDLLNNPNTNMDAILRDFGKRTMQEDPVIHFYELFLKEYDKKKKVERGVFYTPQPVVSYIVRSVHELLKAELGLEDGLASTTTWGEMSKRIPDIKIPNGTSTDEPFVKILDPATGTATFLVEAIEIIYNTMTEKWKREGHLALELPGLWNDYVPKHLLPRLFGFELMMAPYAIAHMKIGLKLFETGYQFGSNERAHIYLTNSLEPPSDAAEQQTFEVLSPALAHEAKAVNAVKRNRRFTVVIGNPPYFGEAGVGGQWIQRLMRGIDSQTWHKTQNYFEVDGNSLNERNPKWLNDDYVKFIRLGEWQIEKTGIGVLSFIANHSYLDNPTFRGMRHSLLETFNHLYFYDLHGNAKKRESAPDGGKDVNVFDIEQGVAISICLKLFSTNRRNINHANLYGFRDVKYATLLRQDVKTTKWELINPKTEFYFFVPQDIELLPEYQKGWKITDIMQISSAGIVTARDSLTIHETPEDVKNVVWAFSKLSAENAREKYNLGKDAQDWRVNLAQDDLRISGLNIRNIVPILYRPFDFRYTYFTGRSRGFICRPRSEVMNHMVNKNVGLCIGRQGQVVGNEQPWNLVFIANCIIDFNLFYRGGELLLPLYLFTHVKTYDLLLQEEKNSKNGMPNFSKDFVATIKSSPLRESSLSSF